MLRIKDPKVSVPFYVDNFGFQLIHKYDFPQWKFSLYFLAIVPVDDVCPHPGTVESEQYLWKMKGTCLELTHNYGTEEDADFKVSSGNVEPNRGFGHIALMTSDVYKVCEELESEKNVKFQKRPDEGRMKGIAFALDPDGYWIEIVSRHPASIVTNKYTFAQTMFRVKDAQKALFFYRDLLGMTLIRESHFSDFSLYFLAHISKEEVVNVPKDPTSTEASDYIRCMFGPIIELTHNHGTEADPTFKYYNGNDQDQDWQVRGFGHVGFLVDDLEAACVSLEEKGVLFKKKPSEGTMRGLAFAYDPDNYWVELIQRGGISMLT